MRKIEKEDSALESFLKACDIYRKLPKDLVESSTSGATISLVTIIILFLLLLSELSSFLAPKLVSDLQVDISAESE